MKNAYAILRIMIAAALMALAGSVAAQQNYPNKPIRFILPYAAGGNTSILARLVGQKLTESWGQPVIVDNRGGGNGIIGTEALLKSPPDGYTILLASSTHVLINPLRPTSYDPIKDFDAVATIADSRYVLLLHPSVPANNLKEFIAYAKARPGELNYATPGAGGGQHLASEWFNMLAGIKMQHVSYKGGGQALTDLIGGYVQVYLPVPITAIPFVNSGKLKALAITGEKRLAALPNVPTFTEAELPGFDAKTWFGFLAPAGTPKMVINKLSSEIAKILAMPDIKEKLNSQGVESFISTPEQFAALMETYLGRYAKIIKDANIKLQ